MMNSVVPVWDGNETWLVLGGGLFATAFLGLAGSFFYLVPPSITYRDASAFSALSKAYQEATWVAVLPNNGYPIATFPFHRGWVRSKMDSGRSEGCTSSVL